MIWVVVLHGDREEPFLHPHNTSTRSISQEQVGAQQALGEKRARNLSTALLHALYFLDKAYQESAV